MLIINIQYMANNILDWDEPIDYESAFNPDLDDEDGEAE